MTVAYGEVTVWKLSDSDIRKESETVIIFIVTVKDLKVPVTDLKVTVPHLKVIMRDLKVTLTISK